MQTVRAFITARKWKSRGVCFKAKQEEKVFGFSPGRTGSSLQKCVGRERNSSAAVAGLQG